jgi:hypothetical protein
MTTVSTDSDDHCIFCRDGFQPDDTQWQAPCRCLFLYHRQCLESWLIQSLLMAQTQFKPRARCAVCDCEYDARLQPYTISNRRRFYLLGLTSMLVACSIPDISFYLRFIIVIQTLGLSAYHMRFCARRPMPAVEDLIRSVMFIAVDVWLGGTLRHSTSQLTSNVSPDQFTPHFLPHWVRCHLSMLCQMLVAESYICTAAWIFASIVEYYKRKTHSQVMSYRRIRRVTQLNPPINTS